MPVSVTMARLGESVTEGTVTRWLKHEGDHVNADEPLLEVSTDKVDTEIPSPVSGTLRGITVAEDETVAVGAELAIIDEDGAGDGAGPASAAQPRPAQTAVAQPQPQPAQTAVAQEAAAEFRAGGEVYGQPYAEPDRPYQTPYAAPEPPSYQPQPYEAQPYPA